MSNEAATAHVEGFSERALNGPYVELETLQSVYVRRCTEARVNHRQRTARTWLKASASGPDFTLRFTNRHGDVAERTTSPPFDRWLSTAEGRLKDSSNRDVSPDLGLIKTIEIPFLHANILMP